MQLTTEGAEELDDKKTKILPLMTQMTLIDFASR